MAYSAPYEDPLHKHQTWFVGINHCHEIGNGDLICF